MGKPVRSAAQKLGIKDHWLVADGVGMTIHGDASCQSVPREITRNYHLDRIAFEPGDVAIDAGAYIGIVSIYLAKKWPGVRVIAVEPVPENVALLRRNLETNGVADRVEVVEKAISSAGLRTTSLWGKEGGNLVLSEFNRVMEIERKAECITLRDLFKQHNVEQCKLLKMDIEGSEHAALLDDDILDRVDYLSIEIHAVDGYNSQTLADLCRCHIPDDKLAVQFAGVVGEGFSTAMGKVQSAAQKLAALAEYEASQRPPGWTRKAEAKLQGEPCDGCEEKKAKRSRKTEVDK